MSKLKIVFVTFLFMTIVFSGPFDCHSCSEIRVALSERPSVILDQNESPKGLDVLIIENFALKFNLHIKYFVFNSSLNYALSNEEYFNEFRIKTNLMRIDLFMGGLSKNSLTNEYFTASRSYCHDELTWCVQSKRPIPVWQNIFRLYSDPVPISIGLVALIYLFNLIIYLMQQFEEPNLRWDCHKITLLWICTYTGFACGYKPTVLSHRVFYTFHVFSSLIFGIIYLSFSLKTLCKPIYEDQIKSIDEIVDGSFELVGDDFALQHLMHQNEKYPPEILKNFKLQNNLDEYLVQLEENPKIAVAFSREYAKTIKSERKLSFYCFENSESIHEYAMNFLVRKDFPQLNDLNRFIAMAKEGGLIDRWYRKTQNNNNVKQRNLIKMHKIKLKHFAGIFMLWFVLIFWICCTFFVELFVHKQVRKQKTSQFWVICEMFLDPHRHFLLENKWH